jgi:type I restriction enzyme S subunit
MNDVIDGWRQVKFKDVFDEYKYGPRFSSKDYDDNGNVKTIRGTDVSSSGEIKYQQVPTAQLDQTLVEKNQLKNGDLVMITTADCGMTAVFYEQRIPYIASAYAIKLTPSEKISSEYTKFFMQTSFAKKQIESFIRKGTVANLPGSDVMNLALSLPPLPEQQKIAKILTSVDEVIEKTQAQIDKLKDLKTGMMQELLTKGIGHTEFKDSPVGIIPVGWVLVPLEDICEQDAPITYGVLKPGNYVENGKPLLQIKDIFEGTILANGLHLISDELDYEYRRSRVMANDIVISLVGTIGRIALIPEWLVSPNIHRNLGRIRTKQNRFVFHYLQSEIAKLQIGLSSAGSSQSALNLSSLRKMLVPVPNKKEMDEIVKALDSIDLKIQITQKKYVLYKNTKKALMQDLLTGKVRVNTAQITKENAIS